MILSEDHGGGPVHGDVHQGGSPLEDFDEARRLSLS